MTCEKVEENENQLKCVPDHFCAEKFAPFTIFFLGNTIYQHEVTETWDDLSSPIIGDFANDTSISISSSHRP